MPGRLATLRHIVTALSRRFHSRAQLDAWQVSRIADFRRELLARLPLTRNLSGQPLSEFPITDKALQREYFAEMNTLGLSYDQALASARGEASIAGLGDVTIGMSSGTSGNRGVFLVNAAERRQWLGIILAKALSGGIWKRQRIALLLAANSRLYTTIEEAGWLSFRFLDLTKGLAPNVAALQEFQPTVLIGPAHVLGLLAGEQKAGRLSIAPWRVFSAAEVLTPAEEESIGATWGKPVHQIYQCTEGFLGITCRYGVMHLNEEYVFFEKAWIDRARRTFNPIITDFTRRTQAMLRYRMNDILVERAAPCPCGSPLLAIERIEGRCDDILLLPARQGAGIVLLFPDDVRARLLDAAVSATDFTILQPAMDRLQIALAGDIPKEQYNAVISALRGLAERTGGRLPDIEFIPYVPVSDLAIKLRRIRCEFPLPDVSQ